ncbi:MAG: putative peptidoglycan glycosyltransferase FtsW [Parcubacteria group bacterium]
MHVIKKNADVIIIVISAALIVLGMAILASASSSLGEIKFGDAYYYLKHQFIFGLGIGLVAFLAAMFVPLKFLKKISFVLLLINIAGLILVFTPLGSEFGTSARWLDIFGFQIQPSELLKFTFIVYISAWLTSKGRDRKKDLSEGLLPFMIICAVIGGLLLAQPSTSILIIIMISTLIVYFMSGTKLSFIAIMGLVGILILTLVITFTPYRKSRILSFLSPDTDVRGTNYHLNQSLITVGSGGLTGVGYGNSTLKNSLPEPIGDSIFAVVAEEFGFVGSMFFIALYFLLVFTGLSGSARAHSDFGKLILIGFSSIIGLQAFTHIASVSGFIPLTGVPLPFVSYGGTALVTFMAMAGLMVNALRHG